MIIVIVVAWEIPRCTNAKKQFFTYTPLIASAICKRLTSLQYRVVSVLEKGRYAWHFKYHIAIEAKFHLHLVNITQNINY